MKSVATPGRVCCCGVAGDRRSGRAPRNGRRRQARRRARPIRAWVSSRASATRGRRPATWSSSRAFPSRQASSIPKCRQASPRNPRPSQTKPRSPSPNPMRRRSLLQVSPRRPRPPQRSGGLNFANSDLAFSGHHLFIGNFNGFNVYDLVNPKKPKLLASIVCPGGQGDVSVHGNLLVMSVEQTRGRIDCGTEGVEPAVSAERFRGVRVFDITDVKKPKQVAAVQTCRGSHTHTLVTTPERQGEPVRLRIGHGHGAVWRGAGRLFGARPEGGSEHGALQHRRHPDPDRVPREGADRRPATDLCRPGERRDLRALAGRRRTDPAHRKRRRPISAMTSRSFPRWAWLPARARATASCWTSRIR